MAGCGAVYVVLGETEALDRLERCTRQDCLEHETQLGWVCSDPDAYRAQVDRYRESQRTVPAPQGSLL